jgi:hypothetical protein
MITGRYPMEAFHDPVMGKAGGIKNVIAIGLPSRDLLPSRDRKEAVPQVGQP